MKNSLHFFSRSLRPATDQRVAAADLTNEGETTGRESQLDRRPFPMQKTLPCSLTACYRDFFPVVVIDKQTKETLNRTNSITALRLNVFLAPSIYTMEPL